MPNGPIDIDPRDYVKVLELLKTIDFLQGVPDDNLKSMLFSLQKQNFTENKKILFQGEISNSLFIIRQGSVAITTKNKGNKIHLADLKSPAYFGEISLLRPTSATATVTAGEAGAELLILTHEAMDGLQKKVPDIKDRIKTIIDTRIASKNKAQQADENS